MSEHKRYSVVDEVFQLRKENATLRADNERLREFLKGVYEEYIAMVGEDDLIPELIYDVEAALANEGKSDE